MKNKLLASIFLLLLSNLTIAENSDQWEMIQDIGNTKVWKIKNKTKAYASITVEKKATPADIKKLHTEKFIQEFIKDKKRMLRWTSIKNWKLKNHRWPDQSILLLEGTYVDHQGTSISFYEIHKFEPENSIQILYTQPNRINTKEAKKFLKRYGVNL